MGAYQGSTKVAGFGGTPNYTTATAGSNGDFYTTSLGALSTNDIVYINFPAATNGASNARLSVNGGTNYYNIVLSTTRIASEVASQKLSFVYDGTNFVPLETEFFPIAYTPTDASGAGLTFTAITAKYIKIGRMVHFNFDITFPTTSSTAGTNIGLPFASSSTSMGVIGYSSYGQSMMFHGGTLYTTAGELITNQNMSGKRVAISITYQTT